MMWKNYSKYCGVTQSLLPKRNYAVRKIKKPKLVAGDEYKKNKTQFEIPFEDPPTPNFLTKIVGSHFSKWASVLKEHPELLTVKRKDIINTVELLNKLNFTYNDILTRPMILYTNALTLDNRYNVLQEVGFSNITVHTLFKYITMMNKSIVLLKTHGLLSFELDVIERLKNFFSDVELDIRDMDLNENLELKIVRQNLLNCYFRQHLYMNEQEIQKVWRIYGRVRHRSFRSIQSIVNCLRNELNYPTERIIKNAFLLYGDADNMRRIIKEIPTINGQDVRDIVYRRPKILMTQCSSLKKTLEHVKAFGISEDAVMRCLEVLTLGPDTILERLRDLHEIKEFQVLRTNPRVLRLVHYQNKARLRLDYLNQLKVRCASLHILSCGSDVFSKFTREGSDRTKGRDIIVFLAKIFNEDENHVRQILSRHPHWCHTPLLHLKQTYDFLIAKKFSHQDIFKNIHILIYPINRIEEKIVNMESLLKEMNAEIDCNRLSDECFLTLVLYFIELEFHFTGDGMWTEQHVGNVENFNNLLPDFPEGLNKVYKYGVRPASNMKSDIVQSI